MNEEKTPTERVRPTEQVRFQGDGKLMICSHVAIGGGPECGFYEYLAIWDKKNKLFLLQCKNCKTTYVVRGKFLGGYPLSSLSYDLQKL